MALALLAGTPAPWFKGRTHARPDYAFSSVGGYYVLLAFFPAAGPERDQAMAVLQAKRPLFDDRSRLAFGVISDEAYFQGRPDQLPGVRYFFDRDGEIAKLYRLRTAEGEAEGQWVLLDPSLRVVVSAPLSEHARVFDIFEKWTDPDAHAGVPIHAPALIVPRVLEPDLCRELINYYKKTGGAVSGVMREVGGRTVGVVDDFKSRRDADIDDEDLRTAIRQRIEARLIPEIRKVFQFRVTRMERYIVARYDAEEGGYFRPHRDNTTKGTAHRQFACSINLNSEEFEGGDLRFPEFGRKTYRPPTGGAVVFSCSLLHEATPVTKGTRYAFLPFFYNEEGARIRAANLEYLGEQQAPVEPVPAASEAAEI